MNIKTHANDTIVMNAFTIGGKKFANIPISEMKLDMAYQRIETNNVQRLLRNWDMRMCEMLHISYRNGYFYILNGSHRYKVAIIKGITHLPCEISVNLTQEEEAKIFASQNENIKRLNTYDIFKANLICGEKTDTIIKKVCDEFNISVRKASASTTNNLKCLTKAREIVKNNGEECLRWIFNVIKNAGWQHYSYAYGSLMISVLNLVYINAKNLDKASRNIINILHNTTFNKLRADAIREYPNMTVESALKSYMDLKIINNIMLNIA